MPDSKSVMEILGKLTNDEIANDNPDAYLELIAQTSAQLKELMLECVPERPKVSNSEYDDERAEVIDTITRNINKAFEEGEK